MENLVRGGFACDIDDARQLRRRLTIAEAEADKWRRLHGSASQALMACAASLALALLAITFLAARRSWL